LKKGTTTVTVLLPTTSNIIGQFVQVRQFLADQKRMPTPSANAPDDG
jgi:NAD(P)H-flavin reductase